MTLNNQPQLNGSPNRNRDFERLVENHNWKDTSLGESTRWTDSLCTAINICLSSNFPCLILWGRDYVQIYNEAYSKLIGINHPKHFGTSASLSWQKKNWDKVAPLLDFVHKKGESILLENHKFISVKTGQPEERYYTLSYSAINWAESEAEGIFITVFDKTETVKRQQLIDALHNQPIQQLFLQAPLALSILHGPQFTVEFANDRMLELWGRTIDEVTGRPVFDAVSDARNQGYEELLHKVFHEGEKIVLDENPLVLKRKGKIEQLYIKVLYEPLRSESGHVTGIMVVADDITAQVAARKQVEESEFRVKLAVEAAEIGTYEWDIVNDTFQFSQRLASIFGYSETAGLIQSSFGNRIHPEDQPARLAAHKDSFETGKLFYEARIVLPDGSIRWVRVNGKVVFDFAGKPSKMYGTTIDITDQRLNADLLTDAVRERTIELEKKNEALEKSEERFQRMIKEVQDYAIILLDTDGIIQNWNIGAEKIKGYTENEIIGKSFQIFYPMQDALEGLPLKLLNQAKREGKATHEGWRVRKDGSQFWGSVVITALHSKNGDTIGFSKVTRDLTERKNAEDKLKEYTIQLEAQNRELEQFAYIASHDLQEPLRKIQTFTEILQRKISVDPISVSYFERINNSAKRMSDLIKAVLNYSKLSNDPDRFTEVNLNEVFENIKTDFELLFQEKGARIETALLPTVLGLPLQINQLFSNLISNALKFCHEVPVIKIGYKVVSSEQVFGYLGKPLPGDFHEITVTDNGIGFEPQYAHHIFAMFKRLHGKQNYAGTGIGLALCKKIIEQHRGFISAYGEPGKGATFYVYFPVNHESDLRNTVDAANYPVEQRRAKDDLLVALSQAKTHGKAVVIETPNGIQTVGIEDILTYSSGIEPIIILKPFSLHGRLLPQHEIKLGEIKSAQKLDVDYDNEVYQQLRMVKGSVVFNGSDSIGLD